MSLRTRIVAALVFIAVVLAGVSVFIARTTEANLVAQVDRQLRDATGPVRDFGGRGDAGPTESGRPPPGAGGFPADPRQPLSPLYVGAVDGDEVVTVVQPGLSGEDAPALPALSADRVREAAGTGHPFTASSEASGVRWRVAAYEDGTGDAVTVVGLPLTSVDDTVRQLARLELAAGVVIVLALGLVAVWVIRLGIRPIKQMTRVATAIAGGDLTSRVPETDPSTEAGELGAALNKMLGSIEAGFDERTRVEDRLRQFVADASHELRTPVATIRGYAELYRAGALAPGDDLDDAMRRTEAEAVRMGGLVEDLLALARFDRGRTPETAPVDLAEVARDAAHDARAVDPGRTVEVVADGPAVVEADEAMVRQVVANLVGNALVHTPSSAGVTLTVAAGTAAGASTGTIEVADTGPGMAPEVAARAFERFYRADRSRARHHGGSGLGLAIVDAVVRAHGGAVSLDTAPGEGTKVRVTLPAAHDPRG